METENKCYDVDTKWAMENKAWVHIEQFIKRKNRQDIILTCVKNGHELICCNGLKNQPYFRHKNPEDLLCNSMMSEWHREWQTHFSRTEVEFNKKCNNQIKNRRADALLEEHNIIIEIQHSCIERQEVENRKNDYKLHNKEIIWVVDGNYDIIVKNLKTSNRVYFEFTKEFWKYQSFLDYEYIFINIKNDIYKVYPSKVKSNMIDVQSPQSKVKFINSLKNNENIWSNDEPLQTTYYIKQQGAGNGKTFGIIQMLQSQEFEHYSYFIIVSKQHSAKYVIYKEFKEQIENGLLQYLVLKEEPEISGKQYIIKFFNKNTKRQCFIIIGTIDSLMYCIGDKKHKEINLFEGIVNSIIDNTKIISNTIDYGGLTPKLNKETILIIDETQDLSIDYAKAIIQIMLNKYIDAYIVGDKLQSISYEENAFCYLIDNEFSNINKIIYPFTNICRRFYDNELVEFVNTVVPFGNFKLPSITPYKIVDEENKEKSIEIINFYKKPFPDDKWDIEVDKIMEKYKYEVEKYDRKPEDFLIVTPFTTRNVLVDLLTIAINIYWCEKNNDNDEYFRYAIFHKAELGTSINLSESSKSTRVVSIHTSKGDGRDVVFVVGLTETTLKLFTTEKSTDNLIYNSLLHVAFTRMKEKLYICLLNNGDDINKRLIKYSNNFKIKPFLYISKNLKLNKLINNFDKKIYKNLNELIIEESNILPLEEIKGSKKIIDMGHHNIRYASNVIQLYLLIIDYERKNKGVIKHIYAEISNCSSSKSTITHQIHEWKKYNDILYNNKKKGCYNVGNLNEKESIIPILNISKNGRDYKKYHIIIYEFIKHIQTKINNHFYELCCFESIIFYYMFQVVNSGQNTDIHINDIYNITDIYSKSFDIELINNHENCLCKMYFFDDNKIIIENNKKIDDMKDYIYKHYEKMNKIKDNYKMLCSMYPTINWNINHELNFEGKKNKFKISKTFKLIGYNDENVLIVYIKPQFNRLNYNELLIENIFDTFLIKNLKKCKDEITINDDKIVKYDKMMKYDKIMIDNNKFSGKKITGVVLTTDLDEPYFINWENNEGVDLIEKSQTYIKEVILKNLTLENYIEHFSSLYYFYHYWLEEIKMNRQIKPDEIIDQIIDECDNLQKDDKGKIIKEFPSFISEFFHNIKFEIKQVKKNVEKNRILNKYDDENYFNEKLYEILEETVNNYLDINNYESDDEEEE
jgi:hypothetical protein